MKPETMSGEVNTGFTAARWRRLAERLRQGHDTALLTVSRLQDVVRSYKQARPLLRDLHEDLLTHWEWQDAACYAALGRALADERADEKMCEFLLHDLKELKVAFLVFFDTHSGAFGDAESRNFSRDAVAFLRKVLTRIGMEEEYLLPMLEKAAKVTRSK